METIMTQDETLVVTRRTTRGRKGSEASLEIHTERSEASTGPSRILLLLRMMALLHLA